MNKVNNWFKPWVSKSAFYSIQKERCYKRGRVFFSATQAVDTLFLIFQFIIEITNYFYIPWFILILRLSSCMILQGEKINLQEAHKIASNVDVIYHVHFIWANYTSIEQFMGPSTLFFSSFLKATCFLECLQGIDVLQLSLKIGKRSKNNRKICA